MKRIALDTNIVNRIADSDGLLDQVCAAAKAGRIVIIGIPTVRNELEHTSCLDRRSLLVGVYDQLPREDVLDQAGVWGVGRWGQAIYGDGSHTGVSIESTRTNERRSGAGDGIIAVTASGTADILVTEDQDLAQTVRGSTARCEVWTFDQLMQFIHADE